MSVLQIDRTPTCWTLTLNRPDRLNALDEELVEALSQAFDEAVAAEVPVVALRGNGRCFSAGFDMSEVDSSSDGDLLLRFVRIESLLQRIAAAPCLSLVFAHGRNFGAGVDLIAACDQRVAASDASFRMPGLQFGLVLGSARFARIVGTAQARRLLETSATFDAGQALADGFIERVATAEQFPELQRAATERALALPARSRRLLREALSEQQSWDRDLAALVRSAAAPGLKQRIQEYRRNAAQQRAPRKES